MRRQCMALWVNFNPRTREECDRNILLVIAQIIFKIHYLFLIPILKLRKILVFLLETITNICLTLFLVGTYFITCLFVSSYSIRTSVSGLYESFRPNDSTFLIQFFPK